MSFNISGKLVYVKKVYKLISANLFNLVLFVVLLNLLLSFYYGVKDDSWIKDALRPYLQKDRTMRLIKSYETIENPKEIYKIILEQFKTIKFKYLPWVGFGGREFKGEYVNITKSGYRLNSKNSKEINFEGDFNSENRLVVFTFGGSTMFGFSVPDSNTISAYLEKILSKKLLKRKVTVINFGRIFYYSSQEMVLFMNLLKNNIVPDVAVFLDGLNDVRILRHDDKPLLSSKLDKLFSKDFYYNSNAFPITRAMSAFSNFTGLKKKNNVQTEDVNLSKQADNILSFYEKNLKLIKLIAKEYNVKAYFFWEPVPHYSYNLKNHLFRDEELDSSHRMYSLYNNVYSKMKANPIKDVIWIADIFKERKHVYIDNTHYNPKSSELIAETIALKVINGLEN